jgi:hypothetical protein
MGQKSENPRENATINNFIIFETGRQLKLNIPGYHEGQRLAKSFLCPSLSVPETHAE